MNWGRAIKTCRVARGFDQKELAERIGVTASHVCQVETETRKVSADLFLKTCEALDISPVLLALLAEAPEDAPATLCHFLGEWFMKAVAKSAGEVGAVSSLPTGCAAPE
jgi:transcriptional regulator with XRE-family HTH domain